jgi:cytochrome c-type biogenesis protein
MELAPLAFLAGVLSISSPCCLPLIPGYLSYVSGVSAGETSNRRRVMGAAALFVGGFSVIFIALGATASLLGTAVLGSLPLLIRVAGVFVILMGLSMLGVFRIPFLQSERRLDMRRIRSGPAGAFPLGMAFAFGWTPCIGPVLAAILATAATTSNAARGAGLLTIYSLGMGIPFLLMAMAYTRRGRTASFFKRHAIFIERAGGVLLVAMGVLLIAGQWTRLFVPLLRLFSNTGWPPI